MAELLTDDQIAAVLREHLTSWTVSSGERPSDSHAQDKALVRSVKAASFMDGIKLVATVAQLAEAMNHHPDIDIRWTTITFRVSTHSASGITEKDLELAQHIDVAVEGTAGS